MEKCYDNHIYDIRRIGKYTCVLYRIKYNNCKRDQRNEMVRKDVYNIWKKMIFISFMEQNIKK